MSDALAGRRIAIAEARELDVFAALLERRGARVLRYPLVRIVDAHDPGAVLTWIRSAVSDGFDDLILLTGEGLRRLLQCIDRCEPALRPGFLAALTRMRKITRGPKPERALRELGLRGDMAAAVPTTAGIIHLLRGLDLRGRRIAVQLYGEDPNTLLTEFLQAAGARVSTVAPYAYAEAASAESVQELLQVLRSGQVDAIAFTSKAQVERLFRAAPPAQVMAALAATQVAAVGPIVLESLAGHGVKVEAMPAEAWFMKPLAAALTEMLGAVGAVEDAAAPPP
jgi:uroporphyrinogen-III synthase